MGCQESARSTSTSSVPCRRSSSEVVMAPLYPQQLIQSSVEGTSARPRKRPSASRPAALHTVLSTQRMWRRRHGAPVPTPLFPSRVSVRRSVMRRYTLAAGLSLSLLALLTAPTPALAQQARSDRGSAGSGAAMDLSAAKPGRDPKQPIDEAYTKKIREYTTEPFFLSP